MRILTLFMCLVVTACGEHALDEDGSGRTTIVFALAPHAPGNVSVLERALLQWGEDETAMLQLPIGRGDSLRFNVNVPPGTFTFTATLLSNNGTALYRGAVTRTVGRSFRVDLPLTPVNAVLVVSRDTIDARPINGGTMIVSNPGSQRLVWQSVTPCGTNLCIRTDPLNGAIAPGAADTVLVNGSGGVVATFRVDSPVGNVDVRVRLR